ncbi:MAG: hypothetical protein PHX52_02055 [Candidatus Pacebacteria bacterium]|nr:hypothetical protein [Candidatus Paceibacterota bacterium]MDD3919347.1 hypothetical protein [Candidatus Paceibacterota bacterium]
MEQSILKTKSLIISLIQFLVVLGIIILAQIIFKNQFITGTIINTLLISSVVFLGLRQSLGIAIIPSLFSVVTGLMAPVLLPFVPFIILGNIILILTFNYFKDKNFLFGGILGSFLKFGFLFLLSSQLFAFLPAPILYAMSYPQLITALSGTFLSFILLKIFKK